MATRWTKENWDNLIDLCDEALQNPPEDTMCVPGSSLQSLHRDSPTEWRANDILVIQNALINAANQHPRDDEYPEDCGIAFTDLDDLHNIWIDQINAELLTAKAKIWCNCPSSIVEEGCCFISSYEFDNAIMDYMFGDRDDAALTAIFEQGYQARGYDEGVGTGVWTYLKECAVVKVTVNTTTFWRYQWMIAKNFTWYGYPNCSYGPVVCRTAWYFLREKPSTSTETFVPLVYNSIEDTDTATEISIFSGWTSIQCPGGYNCWDLRCTPCLYGEYYDWEFVTTTNVIDLTALHC